MSPDAQSSEYVTYEWSFAFGARVPVITALIRWTGDPLMPAYYWTAALVVAGACEDLSKGLSIAAKAVDDGVAANVLQTLVRHSN